MQITIFFLVFNAIGNKSSKMYWFERLYRRSDKANNGTETGLDYRKLMVNGVNEGEELEWSKIEGGDADGNRQGRLLDGCVSLRRVVKGTERGPR